MSIFFLLIQNSASIQPRKSLSKFGASYSYTAWLHYLDPGGALRDLGRREPPRAPRAVQPPGRGLFGDAPRRGRAGELVVRRARGCFFRRLARAGRGASYRIVTRRL